MADNNRRRHQSRDLAAQRSSEALARPPADDPLAEFEVRYDDDGYEDNTRYEEDARHDDAYGDDEASADGDYEDDAAGGHKRGGFIFVATMFTLAVLGIAGAFGYRAIFGSSIAPIIKAQDGPNKIIPPLPLLPIIKGFGQADANNDSNEKLVSREEPPVNIGALAPQGIGTDSSSAGYPIGAMATERPGFALPPTSAGAASTPTDSVRTPPPADPRPSALNQPAPLAPVVAAPAPVSPATKKNATSSAQRAPKPSSTADANAPLSIGPTGGETTASATPTPRPHSAPAHPNDAPPPAGGGYAVQVSSEHAEAEVQGSFRTLQAKYPHVLGGKQLIIRRADLGTKGTYYRALVAPFASAEEAARMCSSLKAAGGSCLVQKN